ncbi:MAG TPA: trypsin-like peptidase domain-containing protein [Candidatus Baltobacteraceae bacterium]|jgi:serine protease Do|nr:trypsin-like peptidase domain-containing protein [Candidatus Baltobacteraceae bacterium]
MLKKCLCVAFLVHSVAAPAETVELKGKASVTGKILVEKRDMIVVDIGYTALVIPRSQILRLLDDKQSVGRSIAPVAQSEPPPGIADPAPESGFYQNSSPAARENTVRELVSEYGAAVVQVRTPAGLGSGFIINPDGFLITNFHVIEGETQISVEVYFQREGQLVRQFYKQVQIIALNKFADLALLRIVDKEAPKFPSVILGDADSLAVGDRVFAIGSPLGLERTVTEGILSTKTRELEGELYLQTTAQINPGNSGGPLFNMRGEVIGVTNMKITFGEGLGFAIPVEAVKYFLNHREAFAYDNDNPSFPYRYLQPPGRTNRTAE